MRAVCCCLALLAPLLAGCLQIDEAITILPDGSGKIHLQVALQKTMLKMVEQMGGTERTSYESLLADLQDPVRLLGSTEGFAAFKPGRATQDAEWVRTSVTAYFEDVNRLRFYGKGKAGAGNPTTFSIAADRGTLTVSNRVSEFCAGYKAGLARRGAAPEQIKATLEFMKPLMATLKVRFAVTVPGEITEMSGFLSKDGSTASSSIGPDALIAIGGDPEGAEARRIEELASHTKARISWSEAPGDAGRTAAFKAELAEAKATGVLPAGAAPSPTPAAPEKPRSLGEDAAQFTDDEVERLFIDAQLKIAREQIERGNKDKARQTLQGVLKDYPKAKAAQEAKKLLDGLK